MIIGCLDLETTGLDPQADQITEVGAVLWDTDLNAPVAFFNRLLKIVGKIPFEIEKLTGITDHMLTKYGNPPEQVLAELNDFLKSADFLMAHNAPFDCGFLTVAMKRLNLESPENRKWIDSCVDVDFPESISTRKLTHLAAEHMFVNPFAHRAVTDTLTMAQIVSKYDWNATIKNALTPNVKMRAMVTIPDKDKAKHNGYRFDNVTKVWWKTVKETRVLDEIKKCEQLGFTSKRIG